MSDFRQVTPSFWASPQIGLADVAEAQARGIGLIVNNRPEGEAEDQVPGADIEAAARAAGLDYLAIPVAPGGFSEEQVHAMASALADDYSLIDDGRTVRHGAMAALAADAALKERYLGV